MDLPKKAVTRNEVAQLAGVSPATVSYVVNNGPRPVAPATRQRVLQAIEQLGYQPNALARNLRLQRTSTLGLILPDTHNPYFAEVARGVEQIAFERGYTVMLCHSDYSLERELHYVHVLYAERAAGVIWFPATADSEPALRLADYGVPLVILDRVAPGTQAPCVLADNFRGGFLAAQHLLELGHTRIGCIARPLALHHSQERIRGFQAALRQAGLPPDDAPIVKGGYRLEDGRAAAFQLLELSPPPSAIFAYNDLMAIGALRAAHERGWHVPRELSIVGFDDIPQAAFTCPALTTVRQPKLDMGRRGAQLLLDLVEEQLSSAQAEVPLQVQLVIRESTAPANNK